MKKITKRELNEVIKQHVIWLKNPCNSSGQRADLSNVDLSGRVLKDVDLSKALLKNTNFYAATLENVCLKNAVLERATLERAHLHNCNLTNADLKFTNLYGSELRNTTLVRTCLIHADLELAILKEVDLTGSNLEYANCRRANLSDTKLEGAFLQYANFQGASFPEKHHYRLGKILTKPMKGYRRCIDRITIVTFEIPKGAIVFGIDNIRLRTNRAKVVTISEGKKEADVGWTFDKEPIYKLNKTYNIDNFDLTHHSIVTNGIHFYKTKKDAQKYY